MMDATLGVVLTYYLARQWEGLLPLLLSRPALEDFAFGECAAGGFSLLLSKRMVAFWEWEGLCRAF